MEKNWIKVEDRKPKKEDGGITGYVMSYRRTDRQWGWPTKYGFSKWDRVGKHTHTHWMPLPEPPKS